MLRVNRVNREKAKRRTRRGKVTRRRQLAAVLEACWKAQRQKVDFSLQECCRLGRAAEGMLCASAIHVTAVTNGQLC